MGSAFGQMKSAVDPMKSFGKIMEVLNIVMLPLTYVMTILAMVIAKQLMPYIKDIILLLDDLEVAIGDASIAMEDWTAAMNEWLENEVPWFVDSMFWLADAMSDAIVRTWEVYTNISELNKEWLIFIEDLEIIYGWIEDLSASLYTASDAIETLIGWLNAIPIIDGGGGGGGEGPGFDWPIIPNPWGEPVYVPGASSTSTSTNLTIDLRGSIIDDRDKLIRDITEQVIIRLG